MGEIKKKLFYKTTVIHRGNIAIKDLKRIPKRY